MSHRSRKNVYTDWFRASEAAGDYMGIRYGHVSRETGEVEWHFVSHVECDGIGGFARLLRERGAEIRELPQTRHRCRLFILPIWRLWRDGRRQEPCAVRSDWLVPDQPAEGLPGPVAWHLFTAGETREIADRCRGMGVTVNSFLLKHLDQAVRPYTRAPEARLPWVIPVNLRGDIRHADDTLNHVSCVEVRVGPEDGPECIHRQILRRLRRGEHRANHLLIMIGCVMSHAEKVAYLIKDRDKPAGNIGAFSNLGAWNPGTGKDAGDAWLFCPPVVTGQLLGAGCVTYHGRLGLTVQGCRALSSRPEVAQEWMVRWVEGIRGNP